LKKKDGSKDLVLIANFRPPLGKFCLEFPAGMIETTDYEENARRELT
jgi:8-oxo-dGTP pyrophosphatase MutT (NUDIX family)